MVNPKVLLLLGAAVLVLSSAIAIFVAAGFSPEPSYSRAPAAPVTETSTPSFQPPPPIMLPGSGGQVPCVGSSADGCDKNLAPATSNPPPR
jgi:hypothetical protein